MKLILASILMLLTCLAQAQNTSPYWSINGNNNVTLSHKLGTTNNVSLRILTNNVERMKILSTGNVGIGAGSPTARLHINGAAAANAFHVQVNGATKFLIHSGGGTAVGGGSTPPPNGLFVSGSAGIGTNLPQARFHVVGSAIITERITTSGVSAQGLRAVIPRDGPDDRGQGTAIYGDGGEVGVHGVGSGAGPCCAFSIGVIGDGNLYGVYGVAQTAGIYGVGTGGYDELGIGVEGFAEEGTGGIFSGATGLEVSTNIDDGTAATFNGNVYATAVFETSDASLKEDVKTIETAIARINQLRPTTYKFKSDEKISALKLPKGNHFGFLAQEIETIFPQLIKETERNLSNRQPEKTLKDGKVVQGDRKKEIKEILKVKAINYTELIPIMIRGMQEIDSSYKAEIAILKEELTELKGIIRRLDAQYSSTSAWMKQNSPNPVVASTTIQYFVPQDLRTARIIVTNAKGQQLKVYSVNGSGTINFSVGTLPSGTYTYTLVADGRMISTKKLVIAR